MKNRKMFVACALVLTITLGFFGGASAGPMPPEPQVFLSDIVADPTRAFYSKTVMPGDTFDVGLYVYTDMGKYDSMDFLFAAWARVDETSANPILTFSAAMGNQSSITWFVSNPFMDPNGVGFACEEWLPGDPNGSILLGTITLTAPTAGVATLQTAFLWPQDPQIIQFESFDYVNLEGTVDFLGGEITVVPIPGAVLLLGSGLLGLIGIRRRMT